MTFKQSTFEEIITSEKEMIETAENRYGAYYANAFGFVVFLNDFLDSIHADRFIFAMFLSQIRKHSLLALFSTVRLHRVQAMMDLRQVLEAGACAAYAIANVDIKDFADINGSGIMDPSQDLTKKRYDWLDKNYKKGSDAIRNMKNSINSSAAHSNIVYAHNNFNFNQKTDKFEIPFFDIEDDYHVKTNLWTIGNVIMGLTDLFYGVSKDHGGIIFTSEFKKRLKDLETENHGLKAEMMETDRYKQVSSKTQ